MNEANQRALLRLTIGAGRQGFWIRICGSPRDEKLIRDVFGNEISRDWRSLSRMCGFSPVF
jgi:hypothetical protein